MGKKIAMKKNYLIVVLLSKIKYTQILNKKIKKR